MIGMRILPLSLDIISKLSIVIIKKECLLLIQGTLLQSLMTSMYALDNQSSDNNEARKWVIAEHVGRSAFVLQRDVWRDGGGFINTLHATLAKRLVDESGGEYNE